MNQKMYQLNNSPDFVFESRIDNFKFTNINQRACDFYGYTRLEFLNMEIFDIEIDPPLKQEVRQLYDNTPVGKVIEVNGMNRKKDGSVFPVHVRFVKLNDELALANVRDISGRKILEEQIETIMKEKDDLEKELHELKIRELYSG